MSEKYPEKGQVRIGPHALHFEYFDVWQGEGADKSITIIDKGIGAEFVIHTFDGETPTVGFVIPPEHVGAVIKFLIDKVVNGGIGIAGGVER